MMTGKPYQRRLLISGAVLWINALLFIVLPHFMVAQKKPVIATNIPDRFRLVDVLRFSERKPAPPPKPLKNESRPLKKQNPLTPEQLEVPLQEIKPIPTDVPFENLCFDINPHLAAGPAVTLPDSNPSVSPPTADAAAYEQTEVDQIPITVVKTRPIYPYRALRLSLSGEVRVKFLVDVDGKVRDIRITQAHPPDVFDDSVINALLNWRFKPGRLKGRPVATWVTTTIAFELKDTG